MDLPMDVMRLDNDGDGGECLDELDWPGSVASEERIEGEVETGKADLPGHIHHRLLSRYYSSTGISLKSRKIEVTLPDQFWFQLWFIEEGGLWSPE